MSRRPMVVMHIVAGFGVEQLGGIERFGTELVRHLDRSQVTPILCGLWEWGTPDEARWRSTLEAEGIITVAGAPKDDASPYNNFLQAVRGIRDGVQARVDAPIDVLHSHSEFGDVAMLRLRRGLGAQRLVRTVHNEREWARRPLRRLLLSNLLYPLVLDRELGVSHQVVANLDRRPLARLLGRRAQVMYNSLDFRRFGGQSSDPFAKRAELGIAPHAPVIGTVGRLTEQKGYDLLLQALPQVLARFPHVQTLVVGEGHLAQELTQQAQQLGLAHAVRFLGQRNDVEELLPVFDLFVSPSRWEGLPTVILEAIAANRPIVATAVSGTVELVESGENGLLTPPGDVAALAKAICTVLENLAGFALGAQAIRARIAARFSIATIAQQHVALYRELLDSA